MSKAYYLSETPGGEQVYLNVSGVLDLSEPVPGRVFEKILRHIARKSVVSTGAVRTALGGGTRPARDVVEGIGRLGFDRAVVLAEAGIQAVLSQADGSIHPMAGDLEYDPRGSVRLSEHAVRCGMTPVWRVELGPGKKPPRPQSPMYSATRDASAGGALSSSDTSHPPATHARSSFDQRSTSNVSPSRVTPRTSQPSTNLGSSTTTTSSTTKSVPQFTRGAYKFGDIHPDTGRPVLQEIENLDELMRHAKTVYPSVVNLLGKASGMVPGAMFVHPKKGTPMARIKNNVERIRQKLSAGRTVSNLSDIIGGRIWVDNVSQIGEVVRRLGELTGQPINPRLDEDFLSGRGKGGYRARHVQIPIPGTGMSVEVQLMPREIGEAQGPAHKEYDTFRSPKVPLSDVIAAREKGGKLFDDAWRAYIERTTGHKVDEAESLFKDTAMGEKQTEARDEAGNPLRVASAGDDGYLSQASDGGQYLDVTNALDREGPVPDALVGDLARVGVEGASSVGDAYKRAMEALASQGDKDPRGTLHRLFRAHGFDGIRYRNAAGQKAWLPMGSDQVYDPMVAESRAGRVRMSEFARSRGMIRVNQHGVELPVVHLAEGYYINPHRPKSGDPPSVFWSKALGEPVPDTPTPPAGVGDHEPTGEAGERKVPTHEFWAKVLSPKPSTLATDAGEKLDGGKKVPWRKRVAELIQSLKDFLSSTSAEEREAFGKFWDGDPGAWLSENWDDDIPGVIARLSEHIKASSI